MIAKPTVFVLGAGASAPYNFPTDLNTFIREQIHPTESTQFLQDIVACGLSPAHVRDLAVRLGNSGLSIDEFIVRHPDYREVGKIAIARAVAPWERDAHLHPYYKDSTERDGQRWYQYCFDKLLRSSKRGPCSLSDNKLTIVTFNFDRSFERALFNFVLANCVPNFDADRAREIVEAIPVYHIHGQLGLAEWLTPSSERGGEYVRPYGSADLSPEALRQCGDDIRILDDEVEHEPLVGKAREALRQAEQVCFLGFSYHPLNLRKLPIGDLKGKSIRGTVYRLADGERDGVERSFRAW